MYPSFVIPDCRPLTALCTLLFWSLLAESMWSTVRNSGLNEIVDLQVLALLCLRQSFACSRAGFASSSRVSEANLIPQVASSTASASAYITPREPQQPFCTAEGEKEFVPGLCSLLIQRQAELAEGRGRSAAVCYPMLSLAEQQVPGNCSVKARPKMLFVKARGVLTTLKLLGVLWEVWLSGGLANAVLAWMSEEEICKISCSFSSLDRDWQSQNHSQFYLCPTPRQVTEHCSNVVCNPFSYVFLSSSHLCLFPSLPHSLILSLLFLCPTLPSFSYLFPPLFLTPYFSSLPPLSPPCLLSLPSFPCACSLPYHRYYN